MSVIKRLTEGVVKRDLEKEGGALLSKWSETGLLEGIGDEKAKASMARLLENQAQELLREANTMTGGDVEGFAAVAFPIVRRVFGQLIANELVSVQPMSLPSGLIFFLDFTFDRTRSGAVVNSSLFGGGVVGSQLTGGVSLSGLNAENSLRALNNGYSLDTGSNSVTCTLVASGTFGTGDAALDKLCKFDPDVAVSSSVAVFTVLASADDGIVERSIEEFEYHADMARWMGYGSTWHDHGFGINVHLSGRAGVSKFLDTLGKLTPEARNLITIENDEVKNGIDSVLAVAGSVPIVLDIHHHWVHSGEYIDPTDARVHRIIESWRGVRPAMHYSVSREDLLVGHDPAVRPDLDALLAGGHKKQQLRAHSDFCWNTAVNDWALTFSPYFDIQVEAKGKNLATDQLYEQYLSRNI